LKEGGFVDGQNVIIEYRWAEGQLDRLPVLAADLMRRQVAVIATLGGGNSNAAAKAATAAIPIVFNTGDDPMKMGLVSSINRPGGNITGVTFFAEELGPKQLGLLHELAPKVATIGVLVNPKNQGTPRQSGKLLEAARALGVRLEFVQASTPNEIDKAFDVLAERKIGALLVNGDVFFGSRIEQLVGLAARQRLTAIYYRREFTEAGGLISYGTDVSEAYRQVGAYVARILKGEKAGDLPVMQSAKFDFVINLKTAKALGIDVPGSLLSFADSVIE
jgi:putative ABC transport system substrate-binding protein